MNEELLKRLKQEAQEVIGEGLGGNYYSLDEDKFAELIVRECIAMVERASHVELSPSACLKHHFGLK